MSNGKPAQQPVREQKNSDGSTSNWDAEGDEVQKGKDGKWVKKQKSQGSSPPTTSPPDAEDDFVGCWRPLSICQREPGRRCQALRT
jgi:hypothetical protein